MSLIVIAAGGVLSGCELADVGVSADCRLCNIQVPLMDLEEHMSQEHQTQNAAVDKPGEDLNKVHIHTTTFVFALCTTRIHCT